MNPIDHPHGGGEGRTKGGRHPVSPTGKPAKGGPTRKKRKPSNKAIVRRRKIETVRTVEIKSKKKREQSRWLGSPETSSLIRLETRD